jgi:hypothetical protein
MPELCILHTVIVLHKYARSGQEAKSLNHTSAYGIMRLRRIPGAFVELKAGVDVF